VYMEFLSKTKEKGFTLLEMLISITLFSLVMVVVLTSVLTILDINRKTQSLTEVTNSLNSSLDSMIRLIKSGERGFVSGGTTLCPNSKVSFSFFDIEGIYGTAGDVWDVDFLYDCDPSVRALFRSMVSSGGSERLIRLTPDSVSITEAEFDVTSAASGDCQDKVRILLDGVAGTGKTQSEFEVQTTVTRRSIVGTGSCRP